jgi:hypothetical protein
MLNKILLWFYQSKLKYLKKKETRLKGLYWMCGPIKDRYIKKIEELKK